MTRRYRVVAALLLSTWLLFSALPLPALAQIDPTVRDRVLPAAVQIAIVVASTENGVEEWRYVPVGSGTVISPDGVILTNQHVVDMVAIRDEIAGWEEDAQASGADLVLDLVEDELLILGSHGNHAPEPEYVARVVAHDSTLDLALLQITDDASGNPVDFTAAPLAYVPLGDSEALGLGEPVDIFSYPLAGGDTLTYTTGVVSGFNFEEGRESPAWITTDATISGGSSGGTAINRRGELIGVPTQGSELDCRPGDTNRDGTVDAQDVGCIPVGGSIGQLRPINLARDILDRAGADVKVGSEGATQREASAVEEGPIPADSELPSAMDVGDTERCEAYGTAGPCPTEAEVADYCASGPLFPVGTRLAVGREVPLRLDPWRISKAGGFPIGIDPALDTFDPYTAYLNPDVLRLEPDTVLEISGPFYEMGVCDAWPVRYEVSPGVFEDGYVHEFDLKDADELPSDSASPDEYDPYTDYFMPQT
jgi:S1-C subfamily serine protease